MTEMMERLKNARANKKPVPPIGIIYGRAGIGKTTLAAHLPSPIFLECEQGLTSPELADVPTFGLLRSYEDFKSAITTVAKHAHEEGWRTLVIDTIDALDPLVQKYVCEANGWKQLTDGAYGAGKNAHVDAWNKLIVVLRSIRNDVGMGVVMLGHHKPIKVISPETDEPYEQQSLTLHPEITKALIGHSDFVLFATRPANTVSTDLGFKKKATRAITEAPVLYTEETGAWVAKNRFGMTPKLPMSAEAICEHVPAWA